MGQWIQQGRRNIIETFVVIDGGEPDLADPRAPRQRPGRAWVTCRGKRWKKSTTPRIKATALAHRDGGVPNSTIHLKTLDSYSLGALIYFYERAIAVSGYLMGINPFNQPGVEAYKTNMFALLRQAWLRAGHQRRQRQTRRPAQGHHRDLRMTHTVEEKTPRLPIQAGGAFTFLSSYDAAVSGSPSASRIVSFSVIASPSVQARAKATPPIRAFKSSQRSSSPSRS